MEDSTEPIVDSMIDKEFWTHFYRNLNSWDTGKMSDNEILVYKAIKQLFECAEELDFLNKKAVYLYLRELTGLNTKQIVSQLNKMKKRYYSFRSDWDNCNF